MKGKRTFPKAILAAIHDDKILGIRAGTKPHRIIGVSGRKIPVRAVLTRSERLKDAVDLAYRDKYNTPGSLHYCRGFKNNDYGTAATLTGSCFNADGNASKYLFDTLTQSMIQSAPQTTIFERDS